MFKFLKDKVKSVISSMSKKIEEEAPEETTEIIEEPEPAKVAPKEKPEVKKEEPEPETVKEEPKKEAPKEKPKPKIEEPEPLPEKKEEPKEEPKEEVKEKKGFFKRIAEKVTTKKISESQFSDLFWELELVLLESSVAVEVIDKIKEDLKVKLVDTPIKRSQVEEIIISSLKDSLSELFDIPTFNLLDKVKEKKPLVICFLGINGSGKTTTIAKVAHMLHENNISCVMAAADTFRAAAIHQLEAHANKLGVKLIKHDYGSDPAAVAYDAVKHAEARKLDVVLIDTAGRLHSNVDLVNEMKKIVKIAKPDLKIFVGESITGNDCVVQAQEFDESVGIDGIILAKADVDEKGGAAISISYVTKKPILYLGTGQEYNDLEPFDKEKLMEKLEL